MIPHCPRLWGKHTNGVMSELESKLQFTVNHCPQHGVYLTE